ncbi:MAG: hypothetical protein D6691_07745 [Candidatus Hydrogenedentota bacterium]|uniref:Uncharacterized protein n=1 Tax=Sumerlaea chitinivorans TaxID=2250252 RepID=A0A2Z4Y3R2_SUMC1|nr:hypothetical protein BRCON_1003 [Candidatus Sumerlaea chitinivorans]RMH26574.1 MAG: hypothetical protein D6691_07745 [Candidatus Hydrogenedentota bacterium]
MIVELPLGTANGTPKELAVPFARGAWTTPLHPQPNAAIVTLTNHANLITASLFLRILSILCQIEQAKPV